MAKRFNLSSILAFICAVLYGICFIASIVEHKSIYYDIMYAILCGFWVYIGYSWWKCN